MGKLITLYGINNIGKSTHAKKLVSKLEEEGFKAKYVKYPVYDLEPTGVLLNEVLRNPEGQKTKDGRVVSEDELQLWYVLNRYQFESQLRKWLEEGYIVIAEDYIGTGIAWGTAKGLETEWLEETNKHLLREDLAILFEGERDLRAREDGHIHESNDELVERCAKVHSTLADKYGWKRLQVQEKISYTAELLWEIVRSNI